ncbi:YqzG/YhdC family protein [Lysinibacillus parviboronicapiens]|uniref:DUF3889 domain-containing protein n=1 Tax=Lysinibacillus parviboronicapiens TaxID=436516 RepID=A0ABV2PGW2_9BACI
MMRKLFMALGIFLMVNAAPLHMSTIVHAQQQAPSYAKWGRLAMKETQAKYPQAKIIDYLHEGKETSADATIEKFKLWLKEGNKEFGVYVKIKYTTVTEKVVNIEFQEMAR